MQHQQPKRHCAHSNPETPLLFLYPSNLSAGLQRHAQPLDHSEHEGINKQMGPHRVCGEDAFCINDQPEKTSKW